jgi:hypothetical protein
MAITAANRAPEVNIILDHDSRAERGMVSSQRNSAAQRSKKPYDGIVTSTVFTAYYLPLRTKRIERIQWVNELTKGGVRAFTG